MADHETGARQALAGYAVGNALVSSHGIKAPMKSAAARDWVAHADVSLNAAIGTNTAAANLRRMLKGGVFFPGEAGVPTGAAVAVVVQEIDADPVTARLRLRTDD